MAMQCKALLIFCDNEIKAIKSQCYDIRTSPIFFPFLCSDVIIYFSFVIFFPLTAFTFFKLFLLPSILFFGVSYVSFYLFVYFSHLLGTVRNVVACHRQWRQQTEETRTSRTECYVDCSCLGYLNTHEPKPISPPMHLPYKLQLRISQSAAHWKIVSPRPSVMLPAENLKCEGVL